MGRNSATEMTAPSSPFVGLAAFTPRMAGYFTGRERFALTLAGAVLRSRITVLYGQSGSGKSSVLGAALPQVLRATLRRIDEATQGVPLRLLNFRRWHPGFETRLYRAAATKLSAPSAGDLAAAITRWEVLKGNPKEGLHAPVILVLDQFEEFLLYHPRPTETKFIRDLAAVVADPDIEARVLLALREDSLASLDALRAVIPGILSSPVQLRPLDRKAAEQAIRRPVAKWSEERFGDPEAVVVEDAMVNTLLDQVQETGTSGLSAKSSSNSDTNLVELPLLQLSLERLWEEEGKAEKPVVRAETLEQMGGAAGIAQRHFDQTLEALPAVQRTLAVRLFRYLVTATGGKHAWRAEDLAKEIDADNWAARQAAQRTFLGRVTAAVEQATDSIKSGARTLFRAVGASIEPDATKAAVAATLDTLAAGKARILRTQPDPRGRDPLFELYHDALARPVLSWVQEARVSEAVSSQRRRAAYAIGAALIMLVGIAVIYAFYHRAVVQQQQAQLQEARAVSTLARQATDRGDAMTGMIATLEVLNPRRPYSNAADVVLLDAWLRNRERFDLLGHRGSVWSVAFSPDGKRMVTGSSDNTARVWDLSGATPTATVLEGHRGSVSSVAFSPDGKRVVTGSSDNTARVWDLSGATPAATVLEGHRGSVNRVAFSPDGKRVVTGSEDNTARVWDLSGATPAATVLEGHRGGVWSVAFSPDGKRVVTGSYDNTARVWDLSGATPTATVLEGHRGSVWSVAFSPDGRRVVTGSNDNTARVWDLTGLTPGTTVLEGHRLAVQSVAFSPDGKRVVTGSDDSTARVWATPPVEELIPLARAALTRCLTIAQRDALGLPVLPGGGQDREHVNPPPCS
jgi:Tol biopolymer transport system component